MTKNKWAAILMAVAFALLVSVPVGGSASVVGVRASQPTFCWIGAPGREGCICFCEMYAWEAIEDEGPWGALSWIDHFTICYARQNDCEYEFADTDQTDIRKLNLQPQPKREPKQPVPMKRNQ